METLFIGKNIIFLPETDSTNSYAMDLLKNVNLPEGTVVHTMSQTNGKGQRGAVWNADPQRNLTASIILKPTFLSIQKQFFLYQVAALACHDALSQILYGSQIDIKIKWPNDILINDKKVSGILTENVIQQDQVVNSVVGIGLNVNQLLFNSDIRATSLKLITGRDFEIKDILEILCCHFERYYLALRSAQFSSLTSGYLQRLYGLNEYRNFEIRGKVCNFKVKGLGETGLLVLVDRSGTQLQVDVKEVKWIY